MDFSQIKGFGAKRIEALKSAGFDEPADLLTYFPRDYLDLTRLSDLKTCTEGERVVTLVRAAAQPKVAYVRRGLSVVKVKFIYGDETVWASWFNQPFMAKNIAPDRYYYVYGKLKKFRSSYEIVAPQMLRFSEDLPKVIPLYKPIGKIGSALIGEAIKSALDSVVFDGFVPPSAASKHNLDGIDSAFRKVHLPSSVDEATAARRVLALERLSYMLAAYSLIRESKNTVRPTEYRDARALLSAAINALPYSLTAAQTECLDKIIEGFHSPRRVNALIEGDVGCGKTVVAFLSMYYAALSGRQAVMMVPTEILADQHYRNALEFFRPLGIRCAFLSGSINKTARTSALESIASGRAQCIFGTHALIRDEVKYRDLALAVTDEQHRFGVAQRADLENKTAGADSLVMSATPIPRTLALTLYGELDRLVIGEKPVRRATTYTKYVPPLKEKEMWLYIADKAKIGEQTFVVAPRIDDDGDSVGATGLYEKFAPLLGKSVALLHGRMKDSEKSAVMRAYRDGEIKVLVATTVVEVGVDVQNATTMVIYDADRFGLAQLHQLRGRVGRGERDSYCFVLTATDNAETRARIEKFIACSDGFSLAEYDFRTRGAGDFLGYDQHGTGEVDADSVTLARALKDEILASPEHRKKVADSLGGKYEYFSKITLN